MWVVRMLPEAQAEFLALPAQEGAAMDSALRKLAVDGSSLGAPHSSSIVGVGGTLRELRPRQGRSRWRAFCRRVGDELVIAAIGPEASVDRRGFDRAMRVAIGRLAGESAT